MSLVHETDYGTPLSRAEQQVTVTIDGNAVTVPAGTSIMRGERVSENLALVEDLCNTMKFGSLCALGGFTPYPVLSALKHFREDFVPAPTTLQAAE